MALSKPAAIGIGLGFLVGGYAIYEALCRSPLGRNDARPERARFSCCSRSRRGV